eukprot:548353-Prymnesium_polylepis.1
MGRGVARVRQDTSCAFTGFRCSVHGIVQPQQPQVQRGPTGTVDCVCGAVSQQRASRRRRSGTGSHAALCSRRSTEYTCTVHCYWLLLRL